MSLLSRSHLRSARRWQAITSGAVIVIGCVVLFGWLFNLEALKSGLPGLATMKANTALGFILIGLALWLLGDEPIPPRKRRLVQVCAALVFLLGIMTLAEYIFGWNLGIDQLLFRDTTLNTGRLFPGRMAQASASSFVLAGLAIWLLSKERRPAVAQFVALILIGIGLFAFTGYLYGATPLYGFLVFAAVSLPTAIALLLGGTSLLLTRPRRSWVAVLSASGSGGIMARRLLPAALLVPLIIGWLAFSGENNGLYSGEVEIAVFALANIIIFTLLIWWNARSLNQADTERSQSAARIRRLNRTLAVLSDINQAIVRVRDLPALFEKACEIVVKTGEFRMIWIGLIDPASEQLTLAAHASAVDNYQERLKRMISNETRMKALLSLLNAGTDHVVFNDVQVDANISAEGRADAQALGFQSLVLLPLRVAGDLRGVIMLYAEERQRFDAEELRLLDEMTGDVAFAIEFAEREAQRQKAEADLRRYAKRLEILHQIDSDIIRGDSIPALVDSTLKRLRQIIPCQRANVILLDERTDDALIFAVDLDGNTELGRGVRLPIPPNVFDGYDARHIRLFDDMRLFQESRPQTRPLVEEGVLSALSIMLMDQDRPLGTLSLLANEPTFFTGEYQEIAAEIASQLAIAIRQMRLTEEIAEHTAELERNLGVIDGMRTFLQTILDALSAGIAVLAADGTIINVNATWQRFSHENGGLSAAAYLQSNYLTICDTATGLFSEEAAPAAAGLRAVISGQQDEFYLEYPCDSPAEKRWFGMRVTPFVESAPRRVVIAHTTITERKLAEEALREANETLEQRVAERTLELSAAKERVEAILNNSTDGILLANADLRIQQANSAFCRLFACEPDDYFNQPLLQWVDSDDAATVSQMIQASIAERTGKHIDILARRKDDTQFDAELGISYVSHDGLVCTIRDISERKAQERQLQFYASLQESVTDAVISADLDLRIQSWNRAAERIYGWSAGEVIGQYTANVLPTEYTSGESRAGVLRHFMENGFWTDEVIQHHKDGHAIHILSSSVLFKDEDGQSVGIVIVNHDISERKQVETALRESEKRFRSLLQAAPIATVITDADGVITLINSQSESLFGYTSDELVGQPVEILIPQNIRERHVQHRAGYMAAPRVRPMGIGIELFARRKDGSEFPVEIELSYVETESGLRVITFAIDITERKERERQLRYQASLQESVSDAVIVTDLEFHIQSWNAAAERIYGWKAEEVVGTTTADILLTEFFSSGEAARAVQALREQGWWQGEVVQRHKDGSPRNILGSVTLIKDGNGVPFSIVSVNHDITERKHVEEVLSTRLAAEREFQGYLKELHEITIELAQIEQLDDFYRHVVEQGLRRLGIERLGLLLYDAEHSLVMGTYGTDAQGKLIAEHNLQFDPRTLTGILMRSLERSERFAFDEHIQLFSNLEPIGFGWNAAAVLWNGEQSLGWLAADNAVQHKPASKPVLDILALYALTIGTLLAQKRVQIALRESEALYRLLANSIYDVVIRFLPNFDYLYVSPSSQMVLGYKPEELLGRSDFQRIHPEDAPAIRELVRQLMEHPGRGAITYRFRHKQGHYIWLESTGQTVVSEQTGEVVEFVFSARDVTARKAAEEALRDSEARYRMVADNISDLITRSDTSGISIYVSPSSRIVLGYEPEELVGKSGLELVHPDDLSEAMGRQNAALGSTITQPPLTYRLRHKDGHYIWVETSGQIIWSADKTEVLGYIAVSRDITERKRAAEALALSEQRFSLLVNSVNDYAIYALDPQGTVISWNRGAERIKGYRADEILGQNFARFYTPEDIAQGQPQAVLQSAERDGHYLGEGWRVRKDGSRFWAEVAVTPLRDSNQRLIGYTKISRDLTERKRVEAALLEQRNFLQLVVDNVPGLIMVKDRAGAFQMVNTLVANVYGLTPADMIGKTDADINPHPAQVAFFAEKDQETLAAGQPIFIAEESLMDRYYQTSKIPLRQPNGSFDRLLVVASDITERKNAEESLRRALKEEKELGELKSRFVSMASHEFRTPLATILAAAETLSAYRQRMSDSQIDHRIDNIRDQVAHLKNIIEDVLQLARIQAGRLEFNPALINLDSLCRSVLDEFQSRPDVTQQLIYSCNEASREVKLDKKLMRQIINNLVSNAVKYSLSGTMIFITLGYADAALVFSVRDQGIGIPEADLKHLFEPFHRAANVGTISGTGLGLAITKEAVELHGGTIAVASEVGIGTTFVVTLPVLAENEDDHDENPGN